MVLKIFESHEGKDCGGRGERNTDPGQLISEDDPF